MRLQTIFKGLGVEPLRFGSDAERDGRREAQRVPRPYYFIRSGMRALPHLS